MWADIIHGRIHRPHHEGIRAFLDTTSRAVREHAVQRFQDWRRRRRELAELARLDDRDLADLGITRGDFRAIVAGTYRRDADAFQPGRTLMYVHDADITPPQPTRPEILPLPSLFWPFWPQPSWYERHWLGEK